MYYTDIATKRPLGRQTEARLRRKNKILLHTMVGSLWGTDSYFRQGGYSGTESHFGVGGDGETLQWQDDEYEADANLEANDDAISIETSDHGPEFAAWDTRGDNVPPWTDAQIEAIAQIIAKVATRHDIPIRLIPDTRDSTRGVGYHRQGVDPYRKHGERYSSSYGKVCPGRERIAQIPRVLARAQEIVDGVKREWDEMASEQEVENAAYRGTLRALESDVGKGHLANAMAFGLREGPVARREVVELVVEAIGDKDAQVQIGNAFATALRDGRVARREVQELIDMSTTKNPEFAAWLREITSETGTEAE